MGMNKEQYRDYIRSQTGDNGERWKVANVGNWRALSVEGDETIYRVRGDSPSGKRLKVRVRVYDDGGPAEEVRPYGLFHVETDDADFSEEVRAYAQGLEGTDDVVATDVKNVDEADELATVEAFLNDGVATSKQTWLVVRRNDNFTHYVL